ncbi:hypothetical protein J4E86_000875 [Alternaria arbusti]|uniref:uncharacterized protein n=1 Tax=Alternaria arbusti TaxID=232088 RepID=UPI00221EB1CD|nr:uncharacterized protein J4E86_000875 [Alternaria arbusti]KAI4961846.1 hypothetical protein J4E86_000875 [Alternaria arbusti]
MTNAQNNPQKPSNCYTLAELHQEIAKDEEWRTKFCYLPTVTKEGRGFYSDAELLIGVSKHDEETRVYAELYLATSGLYNLVAIKLPNDSIGTRQQQRGEAVPKLQHIKFLEPFDRLSDVGSRHWCQELRFLVSYYGLEQQAIDRCVFKKDGLEALKRACIHIADEAILWNEKPLRPLLIIPTTTHDTKTTTQLSTQEDYDDEETYFKQEESPIELGKVFENDQALPKKQATSEDEEQEDEDSELMFNRSKRIVRDRVRLQIESLEREENGAQETLSAQMMSFNEALKSVCTYEKALMDAKAKAQVEQAAKTAAETKLEKVRGELTEKRVFEKGFDSFHT